MRTTTKILAAGAALIAIVAVGAYAFAQQGPGHRPMGRSMSMMGGHGPMGRGMGMMGMGRGRGMGPGMMGGAFGFGGFGEGPTDVGRPAQPDVGHRPQAEVGLDPSKGIVVEPEEL